MILQILEDILLLDFQKPLISIAQNINMLCLQYTEKYKELLKKKGSSL